MGSWNIDALGCLVIRHDAFAVPSERWNCANEDSELEWTRPLLRKLAKDQTGSNRSSFRESQDSIKWTPIVLLNVLLEKITRF